MGGVSASVSPTTMRSARVSLPAALVAVIVTVGRSGGGQHAREPPGRRVQVTPAGSPVAENVMGRVPVAAMVCRIGVPVPDADHLRRRRCAARRRGLHRDRDLRLGARGGGRQKQQRATPRATRYRSQSA